MTEFEEENELEESDLGDEEYWDTCENCGNEITFGEFNNTGVTEYCYECSADPRGETFGEG